MVGKDESTGKIARIVNMLVRAVQKFIQEYESEKLGGSWRPYVRHKQGFIAA